ncbi:MAG TPA: hypothetical protein VFK23_01360 [Nitrospirota bacterium]|nr:hypothetical protein [Nitrospirota bacterium]
MRYSTPRPPVSPSIFSSNLPSPREKLGEREPHDGSSVPRLPEVPGELCGGFVKRVEMFVLEQKGDLDKAVVLMPLMAAAVMTVFKMFV